MPLLVPEEVEVPHNKVRQSPRLNVSVAHYLLLYFEFSTFQVQGFLANAISSKSY